MTVRQGIRALAVIPARGGSKRVPDKNIRLLGGRPALAYSIDAAVRSGRFDRVMVTTDCQKIADVARRCGAEVPFMRDESLADDLTPVSLATLDVLQRVDPDGREFGLVAQLMPNCPLRTAEDVEASFAQFERTGARSQISVTRFGWQNPWWAMQRDAAGRLSPLFPEQVTQRSQDLPNLFCPTGAIWWIRAPVLRAERTYHVPDRTGWEIAWERAVDIDTEADWRVAEYLATVAIGHELTDAT